MALDKLHLLKLKKLVQDDAWDSILTAIDEYIRDIRETRITGANEFETLRELHRNEGKVDGLTEFFSKVETQNFPTREKDQPRRPMD